MARKCLMCNERFKPEKMTKGKSRICKNCYCDIGEELGINPVYAKKRMKPKIEIWYEARGWSVPSPLKSSL